VERQIDLAEGKMNDKILPKHVFKKIGVAEKRRVSRKALSEIVRFLARRAAEADYKALLDAENAEPEAGERQESE